MRRLGRLISRVAVCLVVLAGPVAAAGYSRHAATEASKWRDGQRLVADLRIESNRTTADRWQQLAEGSPNFSLMSETTQLAHEMEDQARQLPHEGQDRLRVLIPAYAQTVRDLMKAPNDPSNASSRPDTALYSVDALLSAGLAQADGVYRAQEATARRRYQRVSAIGWSAAALLVLGVFALVARSRRRARAVQRESEERWRTLAQHAREVLIVVRTDGTIAFVTDTVERLAGVPPQCVLDRPLAEILGPEVRPFLRQLAVTPQSERASEFRVSGRDTFVEAHGANLTDDPRVGGILVTVRDISARRRLEHELRHQASHDALTGLANRALFEARAAAAPADAAVVFIDLDDFKTVNDSLGHSAGDELLRVVAQRLRAALRPGDLAARFGGDEFAILLSPVSGEDEARAITERLLRTVRRPLTVSGRPVTMSASAGLALGTGSEELLRAADVAMYAAKDAGKNDVRTFRAPMLAAARQRLDLREDLRTALANDQLRVLYQPIVDLRTRRTLAVEALLRWEHPELGTISPAEFIPLAEETGLIVPIGRWVLERACAEIAQRDGLRLNVNLSPVQLDDPALVDVVREALQGLPPETLTLELTESALAADAECAVAQIGALRTLGVSVAVDDFGTGYSSLSHLRRFPIDVVKLDRSFISGLGRDPADAALVRSIVDLGAALDEHCDAHGYAMYGGGMGELGIGRDQIQLLAALFHPDGPNDVAPPGYNEAEPAPGLPASPLPAAPAATGFRRQL